jgi:hypothetical protein
LVFFLQKLLYISCGNHFPQPYGSEFPHPQGKNMCFHTSTALKIRQLKWLWTFSFFSTAKVPFPLTLRFKPMLQQGIELLTLDASW